MLLKSKTAGRLGAVLPILVVCLVALLGFVALAIDVGMMAVTRAQCQNVADLAAMAGARTLNGDDTNGYNVAAALPNAQSAAVGNTVQGQAVQDSQVQLSIGSYTYDYSSQQFVSHIPADSSDTPNLAKSTVTASASYSFARFFGFSAFNTSATATAVHRPRDVAVILDLSGSMRFDSLLGITYSGSRTQSNNPESVYPLFGHYSSPSLTLQNPTGPDTINGDTFGLANVTVDTIGGSAIVKDFYQNALGATPVAAFTSAQDSYATTPGGDNYLYKKGTTTYAATVQDITAGATFNGYTATPFTGYTGSAVPEYKGYTLGPRYWGKTFFIWPPDPRSGNDWRALYFDYPGSSTTGVDSNTMLWDSTGKWRAPGGTSYDINYSAILAWIKSTPNPFPSQLRAGRILYYDQIPSTINTSSYPPTDPNQRFWKEYIDYVLGLYQKNSSTYDVITPMTGYGDDFTWGTVQISTKPSGKYMSYTDNPKRPQLHFWFGPMTMLDFLGNYNMWTQSQYPNWNAYWPGTCHEGPLWACKLGVQAALRDVRNNHPNDFVSLMFFSTPEYSAGDGGAFNRTRVPLGRDYSRMNDTLWFPPSTIDNAGTEIRPYDATNNIQVPRAYGGTTTAMGFMLAFNQLSSNPSLRAYAPSPAPPGEAGGLGRKGSQRLVILQTDGMANSLASAAFTNGGAYNSYYNIRQPGEYPKNSGTSVTSQVYSVVTQLCALDSASPPGYSTTRKPVLVHCLALGPIFDASTNSAQRQPALDLLQNIQYIGSTQDSPSTPLESYKIITGTAQQRTDRIQQAFSAIMQDGVQVSLIE